MLSAAGLSRAAFDAELELDPHAARHRTQDRAAATGSLALIRVMRCLPTVVTTMLDVSLCVAGKRVLWHAADETPNVAVHLPKNLLADATVRGASEQARNRPITSLPVAPAIVGLLTGDPRAVSPASRPLIGVSRIPVQVTGPRRRLRYARTLARDPHTDIAHQLLAWLRL